jgi:hypothetical protein
MQCFLLNDLSLCCAANKVCRSNVSIDLDIFEWANEAISSLVCLCETKGFKVTLATNLQI